MKKCNSIVGGRSSENKPVSDEQIMTSWITIEKAILSLELKEAKKKKRSKKR